MENIEPYETVRIVKHNRPCGYAIIPKSEYDPRKHTLFIEKEPSKIEVDKPMKRQVKAK